MRRILNMQLRAAVLLSLILLAAAFIQSACAQSSSASPSIQITSPAEGAILPAGEIVVAVEVENFNLTEKFAQASVEGEGHIHYFIDVPVPTAPGEPAITATGTYAPTVNTSYNWNNVTPGLHNLTAELINNDHTPLVPAIYATINVTVVQADTKTHAAAENVEAANITDLKETAAEPTAEEPVTY